MLEPAGMIGNRNFTLPDLTALYSKPYDEAVERWRAIGAIDKAAHILEMARDYKGEIESVLEVGCGTGAVMQNLRMSCFGSRFVGLEIGSERSKPKSPLDTGIEIKGFDGITLPYPDESFDLVYASHVLEHVLDVRGFLKEMRRVTQRMVFVEVPCELHLRVSMRTLQETLNIGHINAYTPESFALTLETSGLRIKDLKLFEHSLAFHQFHSNKAKALAKSFIRRSFLSVSKRLASRLFTYHCAALCEKGPLI
jgi:ubiquinone/menaquinone biosynthesis C-methylase UbiE